MKITEMSREFTKQEQYLMTKSPSITPVKNIPDHTELTVKGWLTFTDENNKGEESRMLSIIGEQLDTDSGELVSTVWSCQSDTFKRGFNNLVEIFGNDTFSIKKISGLTKAGRDFINCDLAV